MLMSKHFEALALVALSSTLLAACAPSAPDGTESRQQAVGGWLANNSSQAFGGAIDGTPIRGIFYSTTPPSGTAPSATGWWLRDQNSDYYAPIERITYNDQPVTQLRTNQGWLEVTVGGAAVRAQGSFDLQFTIGGTVNATLRMLRSDDAHSYGKYTTEWLKDGGSEWAPFCPHAYVNSDNVTVNLTEYMIPVGGAKWQLNGSRVDDSAAIQLSCTHDSIGGCVTWGYAPWDSQAGTSLKNTHQACTRMKRADFCGTGDPSTTMNLSGYLHTTIQVWDSLAIHPIGAQTPATMEAFWGPAGATCLNRSEYRSDLPNYVAHLQALLSSNGCPNIPVCGKSSSGLTASARPCLAVDSTTGLCSAN